MNNVIECLMKQKEDQEKQLQVIQHDINVTNKCLRDEIFKETNLLNKVLKNNLIEIIQLIHKRNLKCSSVNNAETIWHDTVYTISDGAYFVDIMAKDGTIVMNYNCKANDGGGKKLCEKVHDLLDFDIIPYCERKKVELDV